MHEWIAFIFVLLLFVDVVVLGVDVVIVVITITGFSRLIMSACNTTHIMQSVTDQFRNICHTLFSLLLLSTPTL